MTSQSLPSLAHFNGYACQRLDLLVVYQSSVELDERMNCGGIFSANLQGSLPGLDTAFLLGAGMYHTDRDSMENLRPGTLQVHEIQTCPSRMSF